MYGKTPAQILLRWNVQQGIIPIPKSKNPARLAENMPCLISRWRGRMWRRWVVCIKTVVPATTADLLFLIKLKEACCTGVCGALFAAPAGLDYRAKNEYNKANTILVFYI